MKKEIQLFNGFKNKPRLSSEDPRFSEDVYILDEDNLIGSGCYNFEEEKWYFHTDTLVDYFEEGDTTKFWWFYPPFVVPTSKDKKDCDHYFPLGKNGQYNNCEFCNIPKV